MHTHEWNKPYERSLSSDDADARWSSRYMCNLAHATCADRWIREASIVEIHNSQQTWWSRHPTNRWCLSPPRATPCLLIWNFYDRSIVRCGSLDQINRNNPPHIPRKIEISAQQTIIRLVWWLIKYVSNKQLRQTKQTASDRVRCGLYIMHLITVQVLNNINLNTLLCCEHSSRA